MEVCKRLVLLKKRLKKQRAIKYLPFQRISSRFLGIMICFVLGGILIICHAGTWIGRQRGQQTMAGEGQYSVQKVENAIYFARQKSRKYQ
jgi:hypothetical protein